MIAYFIDKAESEKTNTLAIRVVEGAIEEFRFHEKKPQPKLLESYLRKSASSPHDLALLDLLIKEELCFIKSSKGNTFQPHSHSFHLIHLSKAKAIAGLKLLAATGQLYFKDKQLAADFYGKVEAGYIIESISSHTIQVKGMLSWKDHEISIQDCDFVGQGSPHWFIRGISLKVISSDISWRELKRFYENGSITLEGNLKDEFLEEAKEREKEGGPRLNFINAEDTQKPDPLPLLILKDKSGAFADLWFEYGNGQTAPLHDTAKKLSIRREPNAEKLWEKDLLETDYTKKIVDSSHYYCPIDKVSKSLLFLLEIGWKIIDWKGNRVVKQCESRLFLEEDKQAITVKGKISFIGFEADVKDVMGAFNRREKFVQLGTSTVGLLPEKWEQPALQGLADEGEIVSDGIRLKKNRIGLIKDLWNETPGIKCNSSLKELCSQLKGIDEIKSVLPSSVFNGHLRPYQIQGLSWLAFLQTYGFHGMLADDMGLGKTVQVLAFLSTLQDAGPHLIVMPTSLLFNWKKEIETFLPSIRPYLHQGPNRLKSKEEISKQAIILTSYTTLRLDLPLLAEISYETVILDEAQAIKNPNTQIARASCQLHAKMRLSITGTPVENHLHELWSHFHFLAPDLLGDEADFLADVQASQSDSRYLSKIRRKIRPFILRRKKEEVAKDLPERIDQTVWVEMTPEQRAVYENFLSGVRTNVLKKAMLDGAQKHRMEILEAILRLRQICCHPLISGCEQDNSITSAKLNVLLEDLETILEEGKKAIVYSQFTSMLKLIAKAMNEKQWSFAYLDGSTQNREKVVSDFQDNPQTSIFLISLKAGGVGLNLTAADYVFLFDPWWNDSVEEQAINRAHRIGRKESVIAKRLVMVESIEEKMMKLKKVKSKLASDLFDEGALTQELTLEDLFALLD